MLSNLVLLIFAAVSLSSANAAPPISNPASVEEHPQPVVEHNANTPGPAEFVLVDDSDGSQAVIQ
jgi:hypothetical protein